MTPRDYWDTIKRAWLLIVATTLLGAGLAYGLAAMATPVYRSQAQLFLSIQAVDKFEAFGTTYYLQDRMNSYIAIIDSPAVIDPVIDELNLSAKPSVTRPDPLGHRPAERRRDQHRPGDRRRRSPTPPPTPWPARSCAWRPRRPATSRCRSR